MNVNDGEEKLSGTFSAQEPFRHVHLRLRQPQPADRHHVQEQLRHDHQEDPRRLRRLQSADCGDNTILVKVQINKDDLAAGELHAGASVTAKIHCGRASLGYCWFKDVINFFHRMWFKL